VRKKFRIFTVLFLICLLSGFAGIFTGCASVNYSQPLHGKFSNALTVNKDYRVIGHISVKSTETYTVNTFGRIRKIEGSKATHFQLMQEAAKLNADDIIDVQIELYSSGRINRQYLFTYMGEAVAIKYINGNEPEIIPEVKITEIQEPEETEFLDIENEEEEPDKYEFLNQ